MEPHAHFLSSSPFSFPDPLARTPSHLVAWFKWNSMYRPFHAPPMGRLFRVARADRMTHVSSCRPSPTTALLTTHRALRHLTSSASSDDPSETHPKRGRPAGTGRKGHLEPMSTESEERIETLTKSILHKPERVDLTAVESFKPTTTLTPLQRARYVEKMKDAFLLPQLQGYIASKGRRVPRGTKATLSKLILDIWQGPVKPQASATKPKGGPMEMEMSDETLRLRRSGNTEWMDMTDRELFLLSTQDRSLARHLEVTFQVQLIPHADMGMLEIMGTPKAIREVIQQLNQLLVSHLPWMYRGRG